MNKRLDYSIRGVKHHTGREGHALQCVLFRGSTKVADYHDDGNGGQPRFDWLDTDKPKVSLRFEHSTRKVSPECALLTLLCRELPPVEAHGMELEMCPELFVKLLEDMWEREKLCQNKTLFRFKGDPGDTWNVVPLRFSTANAEILRKKHNKPIEEFLNMSLQAQQAKFLYNLQLAANKLEKTNGDDGRTFMQL